MPLLPRSFQPSKLKPQLKMAVTRFQIASNKKSALAQQQVREIALLLSESPPKEEKARIKAEALIREDNCVEAYEILQLTCDLLSERIHYIAHSKRCPDDLLSSVCTLLWASGTVDIPELIEIRRQFRSKYGRQFEEDAVRNVGGVVNARVAEKLAVSPPSAYLVQTYLERIAEEHQLQWKPKVPLTVDNMVQPMPAPVGYSIRQGEGSGVNPTTYAISHTRDNLAVEVRRKNEATINTRRTAPVTAASAPPMSPSFGPVMDMEDEEVEIFVPSPTVKKNKSYNIAKHEDEFGPENTRHQLDDDQEVDIFVPAQTAKKNITYNDCNYGIDNQELNDDIGSKMTDRHNTNSAATKTNNQSRGDSKDSKSSSHDTASGENAQGESIDELAAKFEMIHNKMLDVLKDIEKA